METGPYSVGYQSTLEVDHSRREYPGQSGASSQLLPFRPLLFAVWYPAVHRTVAPMKYADYLELDEVPSQPELQSFVSRLKDYAHKISLNTISQYEEDSHVISQIREYLSQFMESSAKAARRAPPAPGKFPVIFYHAGAEGSFDENVILFEYLASHGYVVISSAFQFNTFSVQNNHYLEGTHEDDLQFLIHSAAQLPFVDIQKQAGIGHSAGAQFFLRFIGRHDSTLRSVVILDTTLEQRFSRWQRRHMKDLLAAVTKARSRFLHQLDQLFRPEISCMILSTKENHPDFSIYDQYLKNAERYEVSISGFRHNDYLSQGAMRSFVKSQQAEREQESVQIRKNYSNLCTLTRLFLNWSLQGDGEARNQLTRYAEARDRTDFSMRHRPSKKFTPKNSD